MSLHQAHFQDPLIVQDPDMLPLYYSGSAFKYPAECDNCLSPCLMVLEIITGGLCLALVGIWIFIGP